MGIERPQGMGPSKIDGHRAAHLAQADEAVSHECLLVATRITMRPAIFQRSVTTRAIASGEG